MEKIREQKKCDNKRQFDEFKTTRAESPTPNRAVR